MLTFKQYLEIVARPWRMRWPVRTLSSVTIQAPDGNVLVLEEGKWVKGGAHENSIRIDRNTHMRSGEQHSHIYGRGKNNLLGIVKMDGTRSHKCQPFRMPDRDADKLRQLGWPIPNNNIVEWEEIKDQSELELLLG